MYLYEATFAGFPRLKFVIMASIMFLALSKQLDVSLTNTLDNSNTHEKARALSFLTLDFLLKYKQGNVFDTERFGLFCSSGWWLPTLMQDSVEVRSHMPEALSRTLRVFFTQSCV